MKYRILGRSGLRTSAVGLGALHFGVYLDNMEARALIDFAFSAGVNFIDTGPLYGQGRSETIVGEAIAGRRSEFLVATKVGLAPRTLSDGTFGVQVVPLTREEVRRSVESSLGRLRTDYVDVLQLHAFDSTTPLDETLEAVQRLVEEGKIRAFGCSNYSPNELGAVVGHRLGHMLSTCQCHFNVLERRAGLELIPNCIASSIGVICNRVLCRGILGGRYSPGQPPPPGSRAANSIRIRRDLHTDTLELVSRLGDFARSRSRSIAQLGIAWALSVDGVSLVLAGTRTKDQMRDLLTGSDWRLGSDDISTIEGIVDECGQRDKVLSRPERFLET